MIKYICFFILGINIFNFPPNYSPKKVKPFYKQYEGHIDNKPAVLNLMKTEGSADCLFIGVFYYLSEDNPIYFTGQHLFYPSNKNIIGPVIANSYFLENSILDSLEFYKDEILLETNIGYLKANFNPDSSLSGFLELEDARSVPVFFQEKSNSLDFKFNLESMSFKTFKNMNLNRSIFVQFSLDLVVPTLNDAFINQHIRKDVSKTLIGCSDSRILKKEQLTTCLTDVSFERFRDYKSLLYPWVKSETIIFPVFNNEKIISFLGLYTIDTDRRSGYRSHPLSYDLVNNKKLEFKDVFLNKGKSKILSDVKKWTNKNNILKYHFDENNFYVIGDNIIFILSGEEENMYNKTGKQFIYSFREIKDFLNPSFLRFFCM